MVLKPSPKTNRVDSGIGLTLFCIKKDLFYIKRDHGDLFYIKRDLATLAYLMIMHHDS